MHSYLPAIGLSNISKKELKQLLNTVVEDYDEKIVTENEEGNSFVEFSKEFAADCGITVSGEYNEYDQFEMEYYFPYFNGAYITTRENVFVERKAEKVSFSGACDDVRVGVTLIFYLSNAGAFLRERNTRDISKTITTLSLSGLSLDGRILLPIQKSLEQEEQSQKVNRKRNHLLEEARNGNEEAMESLTMEDMDTYSMISKRIQTEDILSIVESYFMPYGMECDRYHILGEIIDVEEVKNTLTGETLYQMMINCNDMELSVCINKRDLMGVPEEGRRFKGIIWLQGILNFME